jgi:hypothetical protein
MCYAFNMYTLIPFLRAQAEDEVARLNRECTAECALRVQATDDAYRLLTQLTELKAAATAFADGVGAPECPGPLEQRLRAALGAAP